VFEAFVESPHVNAAPAAVPALEYQVTQPAAVAPVARPLGRKLTQRTLLQVAQVTPSETVKDFLNDQRSANASQRLNVSQTAEVSADTVAQAPSTPSLFRSPATETRTEVVEEQVEESTQFDVSTIVIVGNTRFTEAELAVYTKPLEGRKIGLTELRKAVDAITQLYLSKGYVSSRAFLGNQEVTDGKVTIQILEGSIEEIKVEGNKRLPASYITDRLNVETPLRGDKLEEQLRLLQIDPALSSVEASLSPGTAPGKSLLTVRVKEAKSAYVGLTSDNYSAPVGFGAVRDLRRAAQFANPRR
jgi:hemolysin activation/secretion protein